MPIPIIAGAAALLAKPGTIAKVGSFIGGLFKKKNKNTGIVAPAVTLSTPVYTSPSGGASTSKWGASPVRSSLVDGETGGVPEVINDWLGRATKDARTVETTVDNKTILYVALAGAALILLSKR